MVEVGDGIRLIAYKIIETVGAVGIDETVADPLTRADRLINVGHHFEGSFNAVFVAETLLKGFDVVFTGKAEDIECLFTGKRNKFTGFGPVNLATCQCFSYA